MPKKEFLYHTQKFNTNMNCIIHLFICLIETITKFQSLWQHILIHILFSSNFEIRVFVNVFHEFLMKKKYFSIWNHFISKHCDHSSKQCTINSWFFLLNDLLTDFASSGRFWKTKIKKRFTQKMSISKKSRIYLLMFNVNCLKIQISYDKIQQRTVNSMFILNLAQISINERNWDSVSREFSISWMSRVIVK